MPLERLIRELSHPRAFPDPGDRVEVRQTHVSVVFLTGDFAYKVKKPIDLGFLDFSTRDRRLHFCHEEVRLNRRLAPQVYLGVVPITATAEGLRVEGEGEAVEWAVKMLRLPDQARLEHLLAHDRLPADLVITLARHIAGFHRDAEPGPEIAGGAGFEAVARNLRDNFAIGANLIGQTVTRAVFDRLRALTDAGLQQGRARIEARAASRVSREVHGDLRLDHVYHFPEQPPPRDLVIIDCIEFNPRFRHIDPVADMAFLAMDLGFRGRPDLARDFTDAYFAATHDDDGRALVALYIAYRSAVRAKVNGIAANEAEMPEAQRRSLGARSRAHWLFALGELEEPRRRPAMVLVGGLPGTGKSTLARDLCDDANFTVIASDQVRKELAGLAPTERGGDAIYTPEWNERTYAACLTRARDVAAGGGRVLIDANFRDERRRHRFLDAAVELGLRCAFLVCEAEPDQVRARLRARRGDVSDADVTIYERLRAEWEEPGPRTQRALFRISNDDRAGGLSAMRKALAAIGVA